MPRTKTTLLTDLSTTDLKRLLAARERIDVLEKEKAELLKTLSGVDRELGQLLAGSESAARPGRPKGSGAKTKAGKKTVKKTVKKAAKKAVKKTARKTAKKAAKKTAKKAAGKASGKKTVKKTAKGAPRRQAASGRLRLEDVIVEVIRKQGGPVSFKDLFAAIVGGRLFQSKSGNFDNVLRRTLSTSTLVKRAGRGVYELA